MKKVIILVGVIFSFVCCGKLTRDIKVDTKDLRGWDYRLFQQTPAWELAKAVWDDDYDGIDKLVQKDTSLLNYREPIFGRTLLFLTMWHNQIETFKYLLKLGANPNIHNTYDGTSPIIEACEYRLNNEFVKILLEYRANPNDVEVGKRRQGNSTRYTPLIGASRNGNIELVKLLIKKGANINYRNEYDQSALRASITQDKYEVSFFLLQNGADYKRPLFFRPDYSVPPELRDTNDKGKPIYLVDMLRESLLDLDTNEYELKIKIVEFLKKNGIDYRSIPIPEYIKKQAQERYPDSWQEYLEKY